MAERVLTFLLLYLGLCGVTIGGGSIAGWLWWRRRWKASASAKGANDG